MNITVDSIKGQPAEDSNGPKVSILVPVYNGETYLAECLDSILMQDFEDVEILVSDDHSKDQSGEIIQKYAVHDSRIRWWKNPKRAGLTANSNVCLRAARGEYIKFVHQDDKLLSCSAIRKMAAALDQYPTAVLAGSQQHLTGKTTVPVTFPCKTGLYDGRQMIVACFERNTNLVGQPSLTLFRKVSARRGFDRRFTGHMDYEMWCHLLEQGDFMHLAEPLATWRVHAGQQTARSQESGLLDHEHLLFMETYFAKSWLRELASERMLSTQFYHLDKKYGKKALPLTSVMRSQIPPGRYAWWWLQHKVSSPFVKLSRKWNCLKHVPG